jgi:hypothetical protein
MLCEKVLSLVASCEGLTYVEGLSVLLELKIFQDLKDSKLNFMIQHFVLKGLVQKVFEMH